MDFEEAILYRLSAGLATALAEVLRPLAVRDEDEAGKETVREAVGDAMARRRPR